MTLALDITSLSALHIDGLINRKTTLFVIKGGRIIISQNDEIEEYFKKYLYREIINSSFSGIIYEVSGKEYIMTLIIKNANNIHELINLFKIIIEMLLPSIDVVPSILLKKDQQSILFLVILLSNNLTDLKSVTAKLLRSPSKDYFAFIKTFKTKFILKFLLKIAIKSNEFTIKFTRSDELVTLMKSLHQIITAKKQSDTSSIKEQIIDKHICEKNDFNNNIILSHYNNKDRIQENLMNTDNKTVFKDVITDNLFSNENSTQKILRTKLDSLGLLSSYLQIVFLNTDIRNLIIIDLKKLLIKKQGLL